MPPGQHATRHDDLVALAQKWRNQTGSFASRSKELKRLDDAMKNYIRLGNLGEVEDAFEGWKAKYPPGKRWQDSHRNRQFRSFEALNAILGAGDTDANFGAGPAFMTPDHVSARQGVLFLFGNMEVDTSVAAVILEGGMNIVGGALNYAGADKGTGGGLGIAAAGDAALNLGTARVVMDKVLNVGLDTDSNPNFARQGYGSVVGGMGLNDIQKAFYTLKEKLHTYFTNFVQNLKTELMDKFGIVDMALGSVRNLINVLVSKLAASAAPIVGGAMNMVTGITQTIDRGMTNFKAWKSGKGVVLSQGHPTSVVTAITTAMKASLFEGLWTTLKGATSIGLAAFGGISAIVDMVVAGVEMLVKVIWRLVECSKIKSFCAEAAEHWGRNQGADFATKPFAFNAWFRKASAYIPAIPILTLNSGLCGSKMIFLQMFHATGGPSSVISQDEFDKGVGYIDNHLKPWGAHYLKECAYGFTGQSHQVVAAIERSKSHVSPDKEHIAWTAFKKVVGA